MGELIQAAWDALWASTTEPAAWFIVLGAFGMAVIAYRVAEKRGETSERKKP